jgi:hypothetical protein
MSTTEIKIETSSIVKEFNFHFNNGRNNRILFSGPFGTGKSTFLKEYFDELQSDYYPVRIYPVHYSVASNEDVFELIKYDILFHLLTTTEEILELKKEDFSKFLKSQQFVLNRMNFKPLFYSILSLADKIGVPVVDFLKEIEKVNIDYKEFDKETKVDDKKLIEEFLHSFENKQGGIYEFDINSQLISELLNRIKSRELNPTKTVLIIDDLDRLDPEHIFRLFNVFSAHHNEITNTNKFGFDKVIFVCDVENIRKIFHHKYGAEVDFSGYLDKFHSTSPFHFDNRRMVKEMTDKILKSINFGDQILDVYNFNKNERFSSCINALTYSLIDSKLLNLRALIHYPVFNPPNQTIELNSGKQIWIMNSPILVFYYFFKNFYSSLEQLEENLALLLTKKDSSSFRNSFDGNTARFNKTYFTIISFCIHFLLESDDAFNDELDKNQTHILYSKDLDCYLHFKVFADLGRVNFYYKDFIKATKSVDDQIEFELNPYEVLLIAFKKSRNLGYLR